MAEAAVPSSIWLTQTKLQPPRLREDLIPRPRLTQLLQQLVKNHHLTLISAPAGYGKTTLAATLSGEAAELKMVWLALDTQDNDPTIFVSGLVAALQTLNPACGASVRTLLDSQVAPTINGQQLISILINDILETLPDPFVLVLDDLHVITAVPIYEALDYLLERLPWQMRLVVTTRIDPPLRLSRLRARGRLAELRLLDLRFNSAECADLLNHQFCLDLSSTQLQLLEANLEGWAAGLRMLAASLDRIPAAERTHYLTHLAQTDRHIFNFMAEEVLNQQEPLVKAFLLETAVLTELTPTLCRAVTQRGDAALILEDLYDRNLFIIQLSTFESEAAGFPPLQHKIQNRPAEPSYRYHALFAEFLRRQLIRDRSAEEVAELHRRAARAETIPARALDHYFAVEAWAEAAEVLEQVAEITFSQGLLEKLSGWIQTLPVEVWQARPWLLYFLGACAWGHGRFMHAQEYLQQALSGFEANNDDRGQGETVILLSIVYQTLGNFGPASDLARQAGHYPTSPRSQTQLHLAFAWLALGQGDLAQVQTELEKALALAESSGDPGALQILAMQMRSPFHCLPQGIELMERLCALIEQRIPHQLHPWRANLAGVQANIYFWRGQFAQAIESSEQAWSMSDALGGLEWLMVDVGPWLTQLYFLYGDIARTDSAFAQFSGLAENFPSWRAGILFPYALTLWSRGDFEQASELHAQMHPIGEMTEWPIGPVLRLLLRGLLEIAAKNYAQAEQTLQQAHRLQQSTPASNRFDARFLLAYLYQQWGRRQAALDELAPVLARHQQADSAGLIVSYGPAIAAPLLELAVKHHLHADFATRLLAILQHTTAPRSRHVPDTGDILTPREVEVLGLLVGGASNKAIAEQLTISLPTVKTHISRILGKLGASSRNAAAARARELHLV